MKLLYTSLLIITVILSAQSQRPVRPYEPLVFNDLNPKWYDPSFDQKFVTDSTDGYNHFISIYDGYVKKVEAIIYDGAIYTVNYTRTNNLTGIGSYITKRNLTTGAIEWRVHYGMDAGGYPEFPRVLEINSDGNLSVLSQSFSRLFNPKGTENFYSDQYLLTTRLYNGITGKLIEFVKPDFENITAFKSSFSPLFSASNFYREGGKFRHLFTEIEYKDSMRVSKYTSALVNVLDDSIDVKVNALYNKYSYVSDALFRISKDKYNILEVKSETNQLVLRYVDAELNELEEYMTPSIPVDYLGLAIVKDYDVDTKRFLLYNLVPGDDIYEPSVFEIYIVSEKGELLKTYNLPTQYAGSFEPLDWKNSTPVFIGSSSKIENNNLTSSFDVLKESSDGELVVTKSFTVKDNLSYFSLVNIASDDNNVILELNERSLYRPTPTTLDNDWRARATSHISINIQDLLGPVATKDSKALSYQVLPNPTTGISEVMLPISLSGYIQVHDMQGREVIKYKMQSESNRNIDYSTLPQGIYILSITSDDGQLYFAPQKVIKVGN